VPVIIGGTRRTAVAKSVGKVAISASDRGRSERLLGSWGLVSFEQVLASGEVLKPFGDSPSGLILYEADGRMSAQVSVGSPATFAHDAVEREAKNLPPNWVRPPVL
jgi:Lipocalin-like domain